MAETPENPNEETAPESVEDEAATLDAPVLEKEDKLAPVTGAALQKEGLDFLGHLGEAGLDGVKSLGTTFLSKGIKVINGIVDDIKGEKKD